MSENKSKERAVKAGGRVLLLNEANELLLVTHDYSFWYTPGGHTNPGESVQDCAQRELFEETGLTAPLGRLVFLEEAIDPTLDEHRIECYFLAHINNQDLTSNWTDQGGPVTEARFFSQEAIQALPKVFPTTLRDSFWDLLKNNFSNYNPYHNLLG